MAAKKRATDKKVYGTSLSRATLERFLPSGPLWFAYTFSCSFETKDDLAAMAERLRASLSRLPGAKNVVFDEGDDELAVEFEKKQWALGIQRAGRTKRRFDLDISFREKGTSWGSNYALWNMLRAPALAILAATKVEEGPLAHAHRLWA